METVVSILTSHSLLLVLLAGWILDVLFGDPACLPHPIVYMGKWISFWESLLNKHRHRKLKGAVFALASIVLVYDAASALWTVLTGTMPMLWSKTPAPEYYRSVFLQGIAVIIFSLLTFFCLAGHTLRKEVRLVFEAADRSLEDGRKQVARIVGRDTQQLSAQEVRTAALETLAENLSDGVIAPLFWFALLGVPGMLAYKMVNTLDSMIGYKTQRYKDFGCWAAHIDDVANFVPARLTAMLILLADCLVSRSFRLLPARMAFVLRFGNKHASPNSGWPEAALASVLDCRFGGTHNYFGSAFYKPHIGTNPRPLTTSDMRLSLHICRIAELLAVIALVALMAV